MIQQNAENINDSEKHTNSAEDLITNLYGGNVCRVKETCSACSKYAVVVCHFCCRSVIVTCFKPTCLALPGSLKVFLGGSGQAPEKILRQGRALELSHPNLPGHGPQRCQLRGSCPEDSPQLGPGDRRGSLPGRSS